MGVNAEIGVKGSHVPRWVGEAGAIHHEVVWRAVVEGPEPEAIDPPPGIADFKHANIGVAPQHVRLPCSVGADDDFRSVKKLHLLLQGAGAFVEDDESQIEQLRQETVFVEHAPRALPADVDALATSVCVFGAEGLAHGGVIVPPRHDFERRVDGIGHAVFGEPELLA